MSDIDKVFGCIPDEVIREHVIDGGSCWCGPAVEFVGDGHIVIHNELGAIQ